MRVFSATFLDSIVTNYCRLKRHYAQYEPTLQQLKKKYEVAMKEKMLSKLERDRAMGQVTGLQSTLKSMESFKGTSAKQGIALGVFFPRCWSFLHQRAVKYPFARKSNKRFPFNVLIV